MTRTEHTVRARQRCAASPERVFRAFTEPALLTRWFSPSAAVAIEVLAHELRPHGRYRFRYTEANGTVAVVSGLFREIVPPRRLVFTWTWEPPDPHAGIDTLVTVEVSVDGDGTLVDVTHERFPDSASRDRHDAGWSATLARIPGALAR